MRGIARTFNYMCHELNPRKYSSSFTIKRALIRNFAIGGCTYAETKCFAENFSKNTFMTSQQMRRYAVVVEQVPECWNCKKITERKSHMICVACGHLQDVDTKINYFDLLQFPQNFNLEQQTLTQRFRQLQTLVHPDKFSNKNSREQNNSADWSSLINKAYKTLSAPIERGQYILKLHGQQIPQDNSALDKAFLLEMMERNEEVEDAVTRDDLQLLNERIVEELNEKAGKLSAQFEANTLEAAKLILVQMKYLVSIQKSIKNKLQAMMGS